MMEIFAQVFDSTYGTSVSGIRACLIRWVAADWVPIAEAATNADGRINDWNVPKLERGLYRIVFDSDSYFSALGARSAYPEVIISFRMRCEDMKFHVQLTLSPYSYSTYFGAIDAESCGA
jgi:5-hydroxyisourate hydrolase